METYPKFPIVSIKVGNRFRKDLGDLKVLAESIREVGLLHPVVVDQDLNLIAGQRRLEACKLLGWGSVPIRVVPLRDLVKGEFHENAVRKGFITSERVAIKRAIEPEIRIGQGKRTDLTSEDSAEVGRETRMIVANYLGISHDTLQKEEKIVEAAEREPETYAHILERVDKGQTSVDYGYQMVIRKELQKKANIPPLPEGQYDVIYADPPWNYDIQLRGSPSMQYPVMTDGAICGLEVPSADDAILFLWATNAKLLEALEVIEAWGFTYKTNLCWVKDRIGTGYYVRGKHELLLIGKKGDMPTPAESDRPPSVLFADVGEHSEKPKEVYELIEKMYPNRSYLELFARETRESWTSWGNEVEKL